MKMCLNTHLFSHLVWRHSESHSVESKKVRRDTGSREIDIPSVEESYSLIQIARLRAHFRPVGYYTRRFPHRRQSRGLVVTSLARDRRPSSREIEIFRVRGRRASDVAIASSLIDCRARPEVTSRRRSYTHYGTVVTASAIQDVRSLAIKRVHF